MSAGRKGSMLSVDYLTTRTSTATLGPKDNFSSVILGKIGQHTINNKPEQWLDEFVVAFT